MALDVFRNSGEIMITFFMLTSCHRWSGFTVGISLDSIVKGIEFVNFNKLKLILICSWSAYILLYENNYTFLFWLWVQGCPMQYTGL